MKIVAISDTHNKHLDLNIPDGDVIVHAGDATGRGAEWEVQQFLEWYGKLPHKHKVFVAGNHDWLFERSPGLAKQMCIDNGIIYLENSGIEIDGVKFWGSPVTPWFYSWAFNVERFAPIKKYWDLIPEGTNVLITHGPPYGILDEVLSIAGGSYNPPRHAGCEELVIRIRKIKPDVHIFGHIHCGYGEKHIAGTSHYNASCCDEMYTPTNPVRVIDLIK